MNDSVCCFRRRHAHLRSCVVKPEIRRNGIGNHSSEDLTRSRIPLRRSWRSVPGWPCRAGTDRKLQASGTELIDIKSKLAAIETLLREVD